MPGRQSKRSNTPGHPSAYGAYRFVNAERLAKNKRCQYCRVIAGHNDDCPIKSSRSGEAIEQFIFQHRTKAVYGLFYNLAMSYKEYIKFKNFILNYSNSIFNLEAMEVDDIAINGLRRDVYDKICLMANLHTPDNTLDGVEAMRDLQQILPGFTVLACRIMTGRLHA